MPHATTFDLASYWQAWRTAIDAELDRLAFSLRSAAYGKRRAQDS